MNLPPGFYGIADADHGDPFEQFRLLAEEGVGAVQLRCKGWSTTARVALARRCGAGGPLLVLNDDVAAALEAGTWVHVGQEDGPDPDVPFGRSTHDLEQVRAARSTYVGFGPVFASGTKPHGPALGIERLADAVQASRAPIVAIGGITSDNVDAVRDTGVHGWTAIGAVWRSPDPRSVIRRLRG